MQNDATHLHITEVPTISINGAGNGETLPTNGYGTVYYDPSGGARTGVILEAGVEDGQQVTVVNIADANEAITYATAATSHVANGASSTVAQNKAVRYVWNVATALWYDTY